MMWNRFYTKLCLMAIAVLMLFGQVGAEEETAKPAAEKAVAIVNGESIPVSRLIRELSGYQSRIIRSGKLLDEKTIAMLRGTIIEKLINQTLLYQESVKQGIMVSDEEVEEQWTQVRDSFGSGEKLKDTLDQMNITEETIKDEIRQVKGVQKFVEENFDKGADVTEGEAKTFYDSHPDSFVRPEQVRARHILIQPDPDGGEEAKEKARKRIEELKNEIQGGADFAEVASEHSKCPSAQRGGDLGFFERGRMAKPFEDAAFALKTGEMSDIVVTNFGFHLIKLEERRPKGLLPFEDVKEKLTEHLRREKVKEALASYLKQLRQDAEIQRFEKTSNMDG